MSCSHLVRLTSNGCILGCSTAEPIVFARRSLVVVRTERGLEEAEVLGHLEDASHGIAESGMIIRGLTVQDQLLRQRAEKNREAAFLACQELLASRQSPAILLDVQLLLDGQTLIFEFLGDPPQEGSEMLNALADAYDGLVQFRSFTDKVIQGCGPDCGTERAEGHGCGSCSTGCSLASHCSKDVA